MAAPPPPPTAAADLKTDLKAGKGEDQQFDRSSNDFETEVATNFVPMTQEQNDRVRRKIDRVILPLLIWVYFLQILDKSVLGYGAILGFKEDAHLTGNDYSIIGSAGYWAQLAWQPFSAIVMVKVPVRYLMPTLVFCWGVSTVGLACSTSYGPILACRFLLGLFEASCLPLFSLVTATWYRRQEQPLRIALWYGSNGLASILGSLLAFCCSYIPKNASLHIYQILFLIVGLLTVLTAPLIYWRIDNGPAFARFLTEEERGWAVQRVAENQGGKESTHLAWGQLYEAVWSPVTWAFVTLAFTNNTGASVSNVFGPIIIRSLGFTGTQTLLLNLPFGALQSIVIVFACAAAVKFRFKSVTIASLSLPCVLGSALLYALPRDTKAQQIGCLISYYLFAALFACNPLIVSWLMANVAGHTKRSVSISFYNIGASVGNIVGPLLFKSVDAPRYRPGLEAVMALFIAQAALVGLMWFAFLWLNRRKAAQRVAVGKPAKILDRSMLKKIDRHVEDVDLDDVYDSQKGAAPLTNAGLDLTDFKNDEFVYVY